MNPDEPCPECGSEIAGINTHHQLPCLPSPFITIQVWYCTDCDWMTVYDWDREPKKPEYDWDRKNKK